MIGFASPEAEDALWKSANSVKSYAIRLYEFITPQVVAGPSQSISKTHVSFDGWTAKGGERGFFGIVAHFANASGRLIHLPIALPQLTSVHTGERLADIVTQTLQKFEISSSKLGYFVLDNAYANDTAVTYLAGQYGFTAAQHRLRCGSHTLNLIGQAVMVGKDPDSYDNDAEEHEEEETLMADWRKDGPLGVLVNVINYINISQQYDLFNRFQHLANAELPTNDQNATLEPIKPVVTRWNSYCSCFERAIKLQHAVSNYANYHIQHTRNLDDVTRRRCNKLPNVPSWMRSNGLTVADWAVILEYTEVLDSLKQATKQLEGRGKLGRFGALYSVTPVFETLLHKLEERLESYEYVNYEEPGAAEDDLPINLRAAWSKANAYYSKLDSSPFYYATIILHLYYKRYCDRSWRSKPEWPRANNAAFPQLWQQYRPHSAVRPASRSLRSALEDAIVAIADADDSSDDEDIDEFQRWKKLEPKWMREQFNQGCDPIKYWIRTSSPRRRREARIIAN